MTVINQATTGDRGLTVLLAAMTATAPLLMQICLPALPTLARELAVDEVAVQLTFSAYVFTVGPAQLLYGPLSDTLGRRPAALLSVIITLVGCVLATIATSLGALVISRIIQAAGAAGGLVITRAVLSDRYGRDGMAARLSSVVSIIVIVPMVAPLIGGILTEGPGWRSIFAFSAVYVAVNWVTCFRFLPETRQTGMSRESLGAGVMRLLKKPLFLLLNLHSALTVAVFYVFISIVPYLLENVLRQPPTAYGQWFICLAAGYMAGSVTSSRVTNELGMLAMIRAGTFIALAGAVLLVAVSQFIGVSSWGLFLPMTLVTFANGLATPSIQSAAVLQTQNYAGTAAGVIGCTQQLLAGLCVQIVVLGGLDTATPLVFFVLGTCVAIALITHIISQGDETALHGV